MEKVMRRALTYASGLSVAAAGLLVVMLSIAIQSGGVTQQKFETVMELTAYAEAFTAARGTIVMTLIFDNLFVIAYTGAIAIGIGAMMTPETPVPGILAIAGIVATGVLDYAENLHFLTMYANIDAGVALTADELGWRMWASMLKWHIAYLGLAMAGFVIPVRGLVSWSLAWSLRIVLPVVGVLVYTAPDALQPLFGLARYALMLVGFAMFAIVFATEAERAA
jgi:hypothetical protein